MTGFDPHSEMWAQASRDLDTEAADRRYVQAKIAVQQKLWPVLAAAASPAEYDARADFFGDQIAALVTEASAGDPKVLADVQASLKEDFAVLHSQRLATLSEQARKVAADWCSDSGPLHTLATTGQIVEGSLAETGQVLATYLLSTAEREQLNGLLAYLKASGKGGGPFLAEAAFTAADDPEDDDEPDYLKAPTPEPDPVVQPMDSGKPIPAFGKGRHAAYGDYDDDDLALDDEVRRDRGNEYATQYDDDPEMGDVEPSIYDQPVDWSQAIPELQERNRHRQEMLPQAAKTALWPFSGPKEVDVKSWERAPFQPTDPVTDPDRVADRYGDPAAYRMGWAHAQAGVEPGWDHPDYMVGYQHGQQSSGMREPAYAAKIAEQHAPYKIEKRDGKYAVVNDIGETKSTFGTYDEARDYQKALYANVPGAPEAAERKHQSLRRQADDESLNRYLSDPNIDHDTDLLHNWQNLVEYSKPIGPTEGQDPEEFGVYTPRPRQASNVTAEYHYIRPTDGGKYEIWQKGTGKTLSTHDTKEEAEAAFRAMMRSKHGANEYERAIDITRSMEGLDPNDERWHELHRQVNDLAQGGQFDPWLPSDEVRSRARQAINVIQDVPSIEEMGQWAQKYPDEPLDAMDPDGETRGEHQRLLDERWKYLQQYPHEAQPWERDQMQQMGMLPHTAANWQQTNDFTWKAIYGPQMTAEIKNSMPFGQGYEWKIYDSSQPGGQGIVGNGNSASLEQAQNSIESQIGAANGVTAAAYDGAADEDYNMSDPGTGGGRFWNGEVIDIATGQVVRKATPQDLEMNQQGAGDGSFRDPETGRMVMVAADQQGADPTPWPEPKTTDPEFAAAGADVVDALSGERIRPATPADVTKARNADGGVFKADGRDARVVSVFKPDEYGSARYEDTVAAPARPSWINDPWLDAQPTPIGPNEMENNADGTELQTSAPWLVAQGQYRLGEGLNLDDNQFLPDDPTSLTDQAPAIAPTDMMPHPEDSSLDGGSAAPVPNAMSDPAGMMGLPGPEDFSGGMDDGTDGTSGMDDTGDALPSMTSALYTQLLTDPVNRIAASVMAANPGLQMQTAMALARRTVSAHPELIGAR